MVKSVLRGINPIYENSTIRVMPQKKKGRSEGKEIFFGLTFSIACFLKCYKNSSKQVFLGVKIVLFNFFSCKG